MHARSTSRSIQKGNATTGAAWDEIVRLTFEACLNRREGREHIAQLILQKTLPAAIGTWSASCGLHADACRDTLKAMFERVREQVTMAAVQRRMILGDLAKRTQRPAAPAAEGKIFLSRRIPIGDISDMLDAVAGAEAECAVSAPAESALISTAAISV
jgi:hypothetical protein